MSPSTLISLVAASVPDGFPVPFVMYTPTLVAAPVPFSSIFPELLSVPPDVAIPIPLMIVFPLVVPIVLLALFTTSAFVPTIPIEESPSRLIVPSFIAFGVSFVASVVTEPLSTLIAIFCLFSVLLTFIVPLLVISSSAFTIKTIAVLPLPPDTLIVPLFSTFP